MFDLSEKMIDVAKERFARDEDVDYIIADYTDYTFDRNYDLVISSLSIHHLPDEEKKKLYQRIFSFLNSGGVFVNADQVLGDTPFIESLYKEDWRNKVERSGLSLQEIEAAYERTKLDKMSTLEEQLCWLKESGFHDVDCL
ncbi:class I SAM-dependent methyltransferase [Domibacillus sp. DTU_2020_1001157_1_SI_ALB_TIR_016]|uniref:class I SAM-dependent methyltransferase n=1 Tax=Domibacillus sp. DTU_2020_1001157_1_SI_ALB_TIR_016 TaxID=3077789 RepID=UPI0028EB05C7|nr:class I SAM-dependent methyltransferase [Domibacillus sp. DTU_2020_1001157_1_SI_ALB_TIR_016]WNS77725.1 class I SAM-dependent methyltransferase [Domibacillus sp. DTU_2020_1001157_1_SI_ALB_TIR_016]